MTNRSKTAVYYPRAFGLMLGASIAALIASLVLTLESLHLLKNPDAVLSCTFNLVLNCSTVMQSWQASLFFDIPNMYIGLMAFPVLVTVAVAALWGGARFNKGFLVAMNIGLLICAVFAYWLFFSSVYAIQVLCPWCLVVTTTSTLLLGAGTHIALRENAYGLSKATSQKVQQFLSNGFDQLVVASWMLLMVVLVFLKFGMDLFA